eukprot:gene3682-4587_t
MSSNNTDTHELKALDTQIAGHTEDDPGTQNLPRFLVSDKGFVFKPIPGNRGQKELDFYLNRDNLDPLLQKFIPRFTKEITVNNIRYMGMEDLTYGYHKNRTSVADIKMGTRTYDDDATEEKKKYEMYKASKTTTVTLGFRFCGASIHDPITTVSSKLSKEWGKNLTKDNILTEGLKKYFYLDKQHSPRIIKAFIAKLRLLTQYFHSNHSLAFYSSSLLFVFGPIDESIQPVCEHIEPVGDGVGITLKMIDFAHVNKLTGTQLDEGYIVGLENLTSMMEKLLQDA